MFDTFRTTPSRPPPLLPHTPLRDQSTVLSPPSSSTFQFCTPLSLPPASRKRPFPGKENEPPIGATPSQPPLKKRKYAKRLKPEEKLAMVYDLFKAHDWSFGDFLYFSFRWRDEHGNEVHRTNQHAQLVSSFLRGSSHCTPAMVVDFWWKSPDGRITEDSPDRELMYSTTIPYIEIKPVRAALSSFAAQTTQNRIVAEACKAVKPESGLHVTLRKKGEHKVVWQDIGATTVEQVRDIIQRCLPLTWTLLVSIASGKLRKDHNRRPVV